jgi:hypothetical protein
LIKQVYYPYWLWEDYKSGMWQKLERKEEYVFFTKAIDFTGNDELYGHWMLEVIKQWPISCENNLTDMARNHKAWIGHAACSLAFNCPEYITRKAWWELSDNQKELANKRADYAIAIWTRNYMGEDQGELFVSSDGNEDS